MLLRTLVLFALVGGPGHKTCSTDTDDSSFIVLYSHAMNTQRTCGIHCVIACLCQRRGETLAIFMSVCLFVPAI